jgi:hypothetical protein
MACNRGWHGFIHSCLAGSDLPPSMLTAGTQTNAKTGGDEGKLRRLEGTRASFASEVIPAFTS